MDTCRVIEVIETTLTRRGAGKDSSDPVRVITQYWSRDGKLLAEVDPHVAKKVDPHVAKTDAPIPLVKYPPADPSRPWERTPAQCPSVFRNDDTSPYSYRCCREHAHEGDHYSSPSAGPVVQWPANRR